MPSSNSPFSNFPIKGIKKDEFKDHFLFKKLLELPDKIPETIYFKGNFPKDDCKFLTVVGSRNIFFGNTFKGG
jgi:hypothetical protein